MEVVFWFVVIFACVSFLALSYAVMWEAEIEPAIKKHKARKAFKEELVSIATTPMCIHCGSRSMTRDWYSLAELCHQCGGVQELDLPLKPRWEAEQAGLDYYGPKEFRY